jgi:hypothetical protein
MNTTKKHIIETIFKYVQNGKFIQLKIENESDKGAQETKLNELREKLHENGYKLNGYCHALDNILDRDTGSTEKLVFKYVKNGSFSKIEGSNGDIKLINDVADGILGNRSDNIGLLDFFKD